MTGVQTCALPIFAKHVIAITDLPAEAQSKLFSRKSYRERRSNHALKLFGDEAADSWPPGGPHAD